MKLGFESLFSALSLFESFDHNSCGEAITIYQWYFRRWCWAIFQKVMLTYISEGEVELYFRRWGWPLFQKVMLTYISEGNVELYFRRWCWPLFQKVMLTYISNCIVVMFIKCMAFTSSKLCVDIKMCLNQPWGKNVRVYIYCSTHCFPNLSFN